MQVTQRTNASQQPAAVKPGAPTFMDGWRFEEGRTQMEHAMHILGGIGGVHGEDARPMMYPMARMHGYNQKCVAVTAQDGSRRPGMDIDAEQFWKPNWVNFSTDPSSLWQQERQTIEKLEEGKHASRW